MTPLLLAAVCAAPAGRVAADFTLADARTGRAVALSDFRDRPVVVAFLGTYCPVNNQYAPRLAQLAGRYAGRAAFVGVNANAADPAARVAEHADRFKLPFPVLKDVDSRVADAFGAARTPEVFVLDAARVVRYRGRIDDQFAIDVKRPRPTRDDLAAALDEVLAGKPVTVPETEPAGCRIGRAARPRAGAAVTWGRHVARVVQNHCQECHRPGSIGPMPLTTYDEVAGTADMVAEVVRDRRMPPWHADPRHGTFLNDRSLPPADRDAVLAWVEQGCPKGDDGDLPPPRKFAAGWRIGTPDVVLTMAEEFAVPAEMPERGVPYQYVIIDPRFTEDKWVERAEARAGAAEVVHHVIAYIVPPRGRSTPVPLPSVLPGNKTATVLCGTAPGDMPLVLQPGYARRVPAGSKIALQLHYTPDGTPRKDRSSVALVFAKSPPRREVMTAPVFNVKLDIPAGAADHRVEAWYRMPEAGEILAFMPHLHLRGKSFAVELVGPDRAARTVLSVPKYNFNWQGYYRYAEPIRVAKGDRVHCVAHYDNSAKNPNNPDPTKPVYWGEQTWEEMMIGWMDFVIDRDVVAER